MDNVVLPSKEPKALWEDYLFLTKEMQKFLEKQDIELFFELMRQRENLQGILQSITNDTFKSSEEGKKMLLDIREKNMLIMNKIHYILNIMRKQQGVSTAYDGAYVSVGKSINWQT